MGNTGGKWNDMIETTAQGRTGSEEKNKVAWLYWGLPQQQESWEGYNWGYTKMGYTGYTVYP